MKLEKQDTIVVRKCIIQKKQLNYLMYGHHKLKDNNGKWKVGKKKIDMFTKELFDSETGYIEDEPEDWLKLQEYIKDFTLTEDM